MLKNWIGAACAWAIVGAVAAAAGAQEQPRPDSGDDRRQESAEAAPTTQPATQPATKPGYEPLKLELPRPAFKGTPTNAPPGIHLEPPRKGPRPEPLVPAGVRNVARNRTVKSSDMEPIVGSLKCITDGDKEAREGSYVELGPGVQWVQIDLGAPHKLHAIAVWRFHAAARIYHDVVIQIADDADFLENVRTLFNNDHDNSAGLGVGSQKAFWETYEGQLVEIDGQTARYVRLYSNGSTADEQNHYTEVEVYGVGNRD